MEDDDDASRGSTGATDYRTFFENSLEMLCTAGVDGYLKELNGSFERVLGFTADELRAEPYISFVHPDDVSSTLAEAAKLGTGEPTVSFENRYRCKDGSYRWMQWSVAPDGNGLLYCAVRDVTERRAQDDYVASLLFELEHQALHDPLTMLPNRAFLVERLTRAISRTSQAGTAVCVLFIDIDHFKVINDSLGHIVGDQMLAAVSDRLSGSIRGDDTLGRFGGDEFVIISEGISCETDAFHLTDRVRASMLPAFTWDGGELVLSVSVGIALSSTAGATAESLLRDADTAMYRAKEAGRAGAALFAEPMHAVALGRLETEVALRRGIEGGELRLHYQPIIELASATMVGLEGLVRWEHPTNGLTGPDVFIPIAEETGLVLPLGWWVLSEGCAEGRRWHEAGATQLTVAVNLSARQIAYPDLAGVVRRALDESGLDPECLELEITENVLMRDVDATVAVLRALKELGVRISVDDFGTGYSSLSYLKRFPVDVLKIDRSFIHGLGTDPDDSAIVTAVVRLGQALDLIVLAEGVETAVQHERLLELGCDRAQGFRYARPMPSSDLAPLVSFAASGFRSV
ncbi:MAG: hypothetical protein NVS3B21_07100 [Acidimicrobiales bacterium]